ncbi:PREDICTED: uncharacterized protein LOC104753589 [Camelina sativa]|uniref:Uncharacterized protein LOC104753589 n=1 Tax=Camelina sativa TaxID=90675 RepID=A0ABM0WPD8_CAMSA|nr:PREDICTED: uncharacterized protein LOC104753589 [Camelina sativa]
MEKQETLKPSAQHLNEAAYKLLANPHIEPTVRFIASLTKPTGNQLIRTKFFCFCVDSYPACLSLKIMRIYTSKEPRVHDGIRENAVRCLKCLHAIFILEEASLNSEVVHVLSPELISCLEEQVISERNFKILSMLVNSIAFEIFTIHEETWVDLCEFISCRAEAEFAKAVFVFTSLSMPSDKELFVLPLMDNLLPAILKRLGNVHEGSVSSQWGLAFMGGFCAAVHLLETTSVALVENLVNEMLKSVNRGMELGFLGKALRDVEIAVVQQLWWYCTTKFRFVLGFIRRIDAMISEETTKDVLQGIKMVVEKKIREIG